MIGLVTTETSLLLPHLTVTYRGGRDELFSGPKWGWRTRELGFTFRISAQGGSQRLAGRLGTINLDRPLTRAIRRVGLPVGVVVAIEQSPPCRLGLSTRTLSVVFSATAPWEDPLLTGRALWDGTPLNINGLMRLIRFSAKEVLLN